MLTINTTITSIRQLMPQIYKLSLLAPQIATEAKPGQFLMIDCGREFLLRRPISIHNVVKKDEVELLFKVIGRGTANLAQKRPGDKASILGPLGNCFTYSYSAKHLLLVAGGIGIAPLVFLAKRAQHKVKKITLLIGANTKKQVIPRYLLPQNIDIVTSTVDGTLGKQGMVTDLVTSYMDNCDHIFACGPLPMYQKLAAMFRVKEPRIPVQISLEVRMGCGFGICYGCSIKTKNGLKQVCTDGPIFNLLDILWNWIKV